MAVFYSTVQISLAMFSGTVEDTNGDGLKKFMHLLVE